MRLIPRGTWPFNTPGTMYTCIVYRCSIVTESVSRYPAVSDIWPQTYRVQGLVTSSVTWPSNSPRDVPFSIGGLLEPSPTVFEIFATQNILTNTSTNERTNKHDWSQYVLAEVIKCDLDVVQKKQISHKASYPKMCFKTSLKTFVNVEGAQRNRQSSIQVCVPAAANDLCLPSHVCDLGITHVTHNSEASAVGHCPHRQLAVVGYAKPFNALNIISRNLELDTVSNVQSAIVL